MPPTLLMPAKSSDAVMAFKQRAARAVDILGRWPD
jgi:hypothetical protein